MMTRKLVGLAAGSGLLALAATGAFAAPVAGLGIATGMSAAAPIQQVYWYHGRYYPYRWHGRYYPYYWHGRYYPYRWNGHYYLHRRWYGRGWHYW